jgi:hypothetical protein
MIIDICCYKDAAVFDCMFVDALMVIVIKLELCFVKFNTEATKQWSSFFPIPLFVTY